MCAFPSTNARKRPCCTGMQTLRTMYFSADAPRLYQAPRQSCRPRNERNTFINVPKHAVSATAVRKPAAATRPFASEDDGRPNPSDSDGDAPGGRNASVPIPRTPAGGWFGLFKAFALRDSCSPPKTFQSPDFETWPVLACGVALPMPHASYDDRHRALSNRVAGWRFGTVILPPAPLQAARPSPEIAQRYRPNALPWLESPPASRFANAAR